MDEYDDGLTEGGFRWSSAAVQQLLSLVKVNIDRLNYGKKKEAYQDIADAINEKHNLNLRYEQIATKWKVLKATYSRILEYKRKGYTVRRSKGWEYFDRMREIMNPTKNPLEANSSDGDNTQNDIIAQLDCSDDETNLKWTRLPVQAHKNPKRRKLINQSNSSPQAYNEDETKYDEETPAFENACLSLEELKFELEKHRLERELELKEKALQNDLRIRILEIESKERIAIKKLEYKYMTTEILE